MPSHIPVLFLYTNSTHSNLQAFQSTDQVRTFTVSVDEETQAMKLTDAQTQEEITLNSIAQQANQPTMSGQ